MVSQSLRWWSRQTCFVLEPVESEPSDDEDFNEADLEAEEDDSKDVRVKAVPSNDSAHSCNLIYNMCSAFIA